MYDDAVQQTNEDATLCKRSAVNFGYWHDPYIEHMMSLSGCERKAPEIHLGYFTRVTGLRALLEKALNKIAEERANPRVQIVNLGAGFDTLYWRLKDELAESKRERLLHSFIEVDLPGVTAKKCMRIKKSKALLSKVADEDGEVKLSRTDLHGSDYHVVAADIANAAMVEKKLDECQVDYHCPTILVAECVLVYLTPSVVSAFLKWCSKKFQDALVFLGHEQLNMNDRFGQVMMENLSARGCGLPGVASCKDKDTQVKRFLETGFDGGMCWTMNEVYDMLPKTVVDRVDRLELFDERELMKQLFEHYCLTVSWRNANNLDFDSVDFSTLE